MNNNLIEELYNRIDAQEKIIRELQEDRIKYKDEINDQVKLDIDYTSLGQMVKDLIDENKHLQDQLNQALKDYDEELEENCKLSKLWKNETEKNRKAIEYIEENKEIRKHYEPVRSPEMELSNAPNYITTHITGYYELLEILEGEHNE